MIAVLAIMVSGCQKYDDSELRKEIDGLKTRLAAVEALNNYKDLLQKLDNGKTVTGVSESNGVFTLTFDDNSSITFNQKGEPGAPGESITGPEGQPGVSPQIKNEDGKWWISTDNGQNWEEAGSSVGTPGENGITPMFRINEENTTWEVSYDEGNSWTPVGSAIDRSLIWDVTLAKDGDSITITMADGTDIVVPCQDPNVVDMGVSVLWSKFNLGAKAPEERGWYFAWGDTQLLPSINYNYKWGDVRNKQLTKYVISSDYGEVDNKTSLDPEDDIVILRLGGKYRMPTKAECEELINNCTIADATLNDMHGLLFTSKINGNTLFFPLAGYALNRWYNDNYTRGYYWTSTLHATSSAVAYSFWVYSKDGAIASRISQDSVSERNVGHSIRPVKVK